MGRLSSHGPRAIVVAIRPPLARNDVPSLCERVRTLLEGSDADLVVYDVGELTSPDAVTVDALARLALTARRFGRDIGLRRASSELHELLAFAGLADVAAPWIALGLERETEEREQGRGVEEERDAGDLTV